MLSENCRARVLTYCSYQANEISRLAAPLVLILIVSTVFAALTFLPVFIFLLIRKGELYEALLEAILIAGSISLLSSLAMAFLMSTKSLVGNKSRKSLRMRLMSGPSISDDEFLSSRPSNQNLLLLEVRRQVAEVVEVPVVKIPRYINLRELGASVTDVASRVLYNSLELMPGEDDLLPADLNEVTSLDDLTLRLAELIEERKKSL